MKKSQPLSVKTATFIYLLLVALTLTTWLAGQSSLQGLSLSMLVLGIALFKAQMVGDYFMGLKSVTGLWRWVISLWLLIPSSLISIAFFLS